jgi:predicted transcriptional regulator
MNLKMESVANIFSAVSDDKSLLLFNTIAVSNPETSDMFLTNLNLTKKQYYSRISSLVKANLVTKRNGKYFLTTFGKIVYAAVTTIEKAIGEYWRLKTVDRLKSDQMLPTDEYNKIINTLIDNEKFRDVLVIKGR